MANYDLKIVTDTTDVVGATKHVQKLTQEVYRLANAQKAGIIDSDQLKIGARQLAQQYGVNKTAVVNYASTLNNATKAHSRNGVMMQQAGYQMGDFLVQVQSGTNWMMAFGQQATQMAGTLTLLGGKMVFLGSVLGVAIPLVTALGAMWMRSGKQADVAKDSVKKLVDELDAFETKQKAIQAGLSESGLIAVQNLDQAKDTLAELRKEFESTEITLTTLKDTLLESLPGVSDLLGLSDTERLAAVNAALDEAVDIYERLSKMENQIFLDRYRAGEQEVLIQKEINKYGEDSLEVLKLQQGFERENLRNKLQQQGFSKSYIDILVEQLGVLQKHEMSYEESQRLADSIIDVLENADISSLLQQVDTLGKSLSNGYTWASALAGQIANARGTAIDKAAGGNVDFMDPRGSAGSNAAGVIFRSRGVPKENRPGYVAPKGSSGGSGGGSAKAQEDYLGKLIEEAEQKRKLIGLSEDQRYREELLFKLQERDVDLNDKRIEGYLKLEETTRKLIEAEEERTRMLETVEGHFEDMLTSMVTGAASIEDAFKTMLSNILLEVYKQQIAKPAAEGFGNIIKSVFGFSHGGAFNNGIQMYANGGVVGSPTMFGHSGGLGVMGEAGPEAIMPLKRGRDGKLGVSGGGNTSVTQVFNISGNGDEYIMKKIQAAAPAIKAATKREIIDDRRRGGAMKEVFR